MYDEPAVDVVADDVPVVPVAELPGDALPEREPAGWAFARMNSSPAVLAAAPGAELSGCRQPVTVTVSLLA
jgi:hypothetical protein